MLMVCALSETGCRSNVTTSELIGQEAQPYPLYEPAQLGQFAQRKTDRPQRATANRSTLDSSRTSAVAGRSDASRQRTVNTSRHAISAREPRRRSVRPSSANRLTSGLIKPSSDQLLDLPAPAPDPVRNPAVQSTRPQLPQPRTQQTRSQPPVMRPAADSLVTKPNAFDQQTPDLPQGFVPWWDASVTSRVRPDHTVQPVDVNSLITSALQYSPHVRAIGDHQVIAESGITQAMAQFDTTAFLESKFVRTSVPTGSTLEAGQDVQRLREKDWSSRAGLRQKTRIGGELELAQQVGTRISNSDFFVPPDQGNTRLTLSYNQPLLNGAGEAYNQSLIVLAQLDTRIEADRTATELQDHLLQVTEAYWELYLQRVLFWQKQRHLESAVEILVRLENRRGVDSLESQISRARAAVATRRAQMSRANAEIQNAEARLRALVKAPHMVSDRQAELLPMQKPLTMPVQVNIQESMTTALANRPEIDAASKEIEAAMVRLDVAQNELLPMLDLVLETYVSGLQQDFDISRSWTDQFNTGEPSMTAGLVFEVPLQRRASRSKHQQRQLELRRLSSQFEATLENIYAKVEVAVRDVETAHIDLQSKYHSMIAAQADEQYLRRRWELMPGEDRSASFVLEDLLDAQDRRALADYAYAEAQVEHVLSQARLKRATGTLLKQEKVMEFRDHQPDGPAIRFHRFDAGPAHDPEWLND